MSIILDALKKAQEERKSLARGLPFAARSTQQRSRWPLYVIGILALSVAVAATLIPGQRNAAKPVAKVEVRPPQPPQPSQGAGEERAVTAPLEVSSTQEKSRGQPSTATFYARPSSEKKSPDRTTGISDAKAREKSRRAPSVDHERVAGLYNSAVREAEKGNTAGARALYQAILAEYPNHIESLNNLGVLAMEEGGRKEAIAYFNRILQHTKDYGKAYTNLGLIMMQEGNNRLAEEYLRKGLEIEKGSIEPALNLAALLRKERRYEEASRLLEEFLSADPRNKSLYLSYALIKDEMGRHEEATRYYKAYLREEGSQGERTKVLERLKVLEISQPPKTP